MTAALQPPQLPPPPPPARGHSPADCHIASETSPPYPVSYSQPSLSPFLALFFSIACITLWHASYFVYCSAYCLPSAPWAISSVQRFLSVLVTAVATTQNTAWHLGGDDNYLWSECVLSTTVIYILTHLALLQVGTVVDFFGTRHSTPYIVYVCC